jgi:hypothetical protein
MKMKEKNDLTKLEFILKLNENIVVQRFFNVKNYNQDVNSSIELYDYVKELAENLQEKMKMKTHDYLNDNLLQMMVDPSVIETSNTDDNEYFYLIINNGDKTICQRSWDAKLYPPKIRYTVDIRPGIKNILKSLTDIFSEKNISNVYMNYTL